MSKLNVLLYSTRSSQRIVFADTDGVMTAEIEHTFLRQCKIGNYMTGGARVMVCRQTYDALQALETKYDVATKKHIRKLRSFCARLAEGDFFYFFNEDKVTIVERRTAMDCINAEKAGLPWSEMLHNCAFHRYSMLNANFSYFSYGYDGIDEYIGEEDVNNRVCRFCGKKMPEATFNNVAHAIQEALGNKHLVCFEECDDCNHNLSLTEDNFRYLMDFRRAMYHIPRKGSTKTPTVVGKTFIIKADANGGPELFVMDESIPESIDRTQLFSLHLELKSPINNERMYKALCKMVIDMLPAAELVLFENTVKWICSPGDWVPDALPSALLTVLPGNIQFEQPVIDIFINNRNVVSNAPYCTAVLWLYDVAYMFVVPLVDVDGGRYKYDRNLTAHWQFMSKLLGIYQWQAQDTSNFHLSTPWIDWQIDLSQPNIHVRPESDSIFDKCRETKPETMDEAVMPDFKPDGIVLSEIVSTSFYAKYGSSISDKDLMDITQHIRGPVFVLRPEDHKLRVMMNVQANDTTDKIPFFEFSFDVMFALDSFEDYINIEYTEEGEPKLFAFHYDLRDYIYVSSLEAVESKLRNQWKGTRFEKCSLVKLLNPARVMSKITYLIPCTDGVRYISVVDREIHKVSYNN